MKRHITFSVTARGNSPLPTDPLSEVVGDAAGSMPRVAVEAGVSDYQKTKNWWDARDRWKVARGDHHPERDIMVDAGKSSVRIPKACSLDGGPAVYHSTPVTPCVCQSPTMGRAVLGLHLAWVLQHGTSAALAALVGEDRVGRVPTSTVICLKRRWKEGHEQWRKRRLDNEDWGRPGPARLTAPPVARTGNVRACRWLSA